MEKKRRMLAVIMAVFMVFTLIPSMVFAAPSGEMGGKLKVLGYATVGTTLKADFTKVTPEGITNEDVSFKWLRMISESELTEVGTEKEYKVTEEDLGYKLVLEVAGKEDLGLTGKLEATTPEVAATEEEAKALVEVEISETGESAITPPAEEEILDAQTEELVEEEGQWDEVPEEELQTEEIPQNDAQVSYEEETEGELQETDDETDGSTDSAELDITISEEWDGSDLAQTDDLTYQAEAVTETGDGIVNLGTVEKGKESDAKAYVTIRNTGTGILHFNELSPEHFMVQDIEETLGPGAETQIWLVPREELEAGEYLDTIIYETEEGAQAAFEVRMNLEEAAEPEIVYEIASDINEVNFKDLAAGYEYVEEGFTVTLTNKGAAAVTLKVPQAQNFDVTPIFGDAHEGSLVVEANGELSFYIQPKTELTEGSYSEELVFGIEESEAIVSIVKANVNVVPAGENVSVVLDCESVQYEDLAEGYEDVDATEVRVTNNGNTALTLAQPLAEYFEVGAISQTELAPGESAVFTLVPVRGLTEGAYSENIQIFLEGTSENPLAELPASVIVGEKEVYKLEVDPEVLDFGEVTVGYSSAPEAQTVTIVNNGNMPVVVEKPVSDYFRIGNLSAEILEPGKKCTFNVRPKSGLEESAYMETIVIPNDGGISLSVDAEFIVAMKSIELLGIQKPSDITGVKNGVKKNAEALGLPSKVVIETTEGDMKAKVEWNVEDSDYDRSRKEAQSFVVKGKVILPDGVENSGEIRLVTSVKVSVKAAYVPKIADASNNKITGMSSEAYTTQSKISFEAVGAGMENTSPRKGDVRYEPSKWKVINTNSWQGAPYKATFGITKAGTYDLKVLFECQEFDGESWIAAGENDTKQVRFTIVQGETVTPTPKAQQKNADKKSAVETGDTTAIMPFVIILIVAVICIAGVVVYRKKKK